MPAMVRRHGVAFSVLALALAVGGACAIWWHLARPTAAKAQEATATSGTTSTSSSISSTGTATGTQPSTRPAASRLPQGVDPNANANVRSVVEALSTATHRERLSPAYAPRKFDPAAW